MSTGTRAWFLATFGENHGKVAKEKKIRASQSEDDRKARGIMNEYIRRITENSSLVVYPTQTENIKIKDHCATNSYLALQLEILNH